MDLATVHLRRLLVRHPGGGSEGQVRQVEAHHLQVPGQEEDPPRLAPTSSDTLVSLSSLAHWHIDTLAQK